MATTTTSPNFGTAGLMMQLGGMFTSSIGAYYGAQSQKSALSFQSAIAGINAGIAESNAQAELLRGQREVGALTMRAGQLKARQRTALAANGVDLGDGNAAEALASTELMKEVDKNTAETNAVRSAWGYRTQAAGLKTEASMARTSASAISPFGSAATSLLGSAGAVASSWYALKKDGALKGTWLDF